MSAARLTVREREHLAVLRVMVMAAGPGAAVVAVRRRDLLAVLAAVDRLSESASAAAAQVFLPGQARASFIAGSMVIYGGSSTGDHHPGSRP